MSGYGVGMNEKDERINAFSSWFDQINAGGRKKIPKEKKYKVKNFLFYFYFVANILASGDVLWNFGTKDGTSDSFSIFPNDASVPTLVRHSQFVVSKTTNCTRNSSKIFYQHSSQNLPQNVHF